MPTHDGGEVSRLFGALSERDRRVVVYYLREHGSASLETLADVVGGWVEAGPGSNEAVAHTDVRAGLHHVHLPTLEAAGVVEYDPVDGLAAFAGLSPWGERVLDDALSADTSETGVDIERLLAGADDAGADDGG